jgi:hypothetical protein
MVDGRGVYRLLVGRPGGKGTKRRLRSRWEDKINMNLRRTGINEAKWIRLAQDSVPRWAFVDTEMNLRIQ